MISVHSFYATVAVIMNNVLEMCRLVHAQLEEGLKIWPQSWDNTIKEIVPQKKRDRLLKPSGGVM